MSARAKDQIKKGYYEKMKVCHPDIAGDDGPRAAVPDKTCVKVCTFS